MSETTSVGDGATSRLRENGTSLIGWALGGWIIVYNVIRIATGNDPADVVWLALPVGAALGIAVYLLAFRRLASELSRRRLARFQDYASGETANVGWDPFGLRKEPVDAAAPAAEEIDQSQEDALRLAVWSMAGFGAVALVVGVVLLADFLSAPADDRPITALVLGGWNIVATLWAADEIARFRVFELEGLDFSIFMTAFTAAMAALGLARDFFPGGQVVLIVVCAVAGGLIGLAAWRLLPKRGVPVLAPAAVLACVAALLLALLG